MELRATVTPHAMTETTTWRDGSLPLNDLQEGMLEFIAGLVGDKEFDRDFQNWSEGSAAKYIIAKSWEWLSAQMKPVRK